MIRRAEVTAKLSQESSEGSATTWLQSGAATFGDGWYHLVAGCGQVQKFSPCPCSHLQSTTGQEVFLHLWRKKTPSLSMNHPRSRCMRLGKQGGGTARDVAVSPQADKTLHISCFAKGDQWHFEISHLHSKVSVAKCWLLCAYSSSTQITSVMARLVSSSW